jgi:hypothetical protein
MQVGFFPAMKNDDGEWLFTVTEIYPDGNKHIFCSPDPPGTDAEPRGMKESVFRQFLADRYKMLPAHIDQTVKEQIGGRT